MIKSKFKRVTSLFLATLMCVTTFAGIGSTTAYAASGEKADVYMVDFPRDGDANYDGVWGHSNLTLKNGWHTGRSNFTNLKAIGSYSGNVAYCIEPGISLKVGQTMNKYDENYFNNLAANGVISGDEIRLFVGRILQYGYRGTISTSWRSQNEAAANSIAQAYATQLLIWETVIGERDANFNHVAASGCSNVKDVINAKHPLRNKIFSYYNSMVQSVQNHATIPSFCNKSSGSAKTIELEWNGSKYTTTLTDSNNVLSKYNFKASISGVSFSVNGNKLTVSMDTAPSKEFTITATKKNAVRRGVVVWSEGKHGQNSSVQDVVSYAQEVSDSINGFVKMKVSYGSCQIVKTSEDGKVDGMAQKGTITVEKTGEVFSGVNVSGSEDSDVIYQPVYEVSGLEGAVYEVRAAEDISTPDGTLRYSKGEVVDTITTSSDGFVKSKELYLGKYEVKEITAPDGMVISGETHTVELTYAGQNISVTETSTSFYNERQKVQVSLAKAIEKDKTFGIGDNGEIKNISFGLYAAEDIVSASGTVIPADGLIEIVSVNENGTAVMKSDLPFGKYYVKEIATDEHYILSDTKYPVVFEYAGQDTATVEIKVNDGKEIKNELIYGSVSGKKIDENGEALEGAVIGIFKAEETEFTKDTALMTTTSAKDGSFSFAKVPYGKWIVREIEQPKGFVLDEKAYEVNISEAEQVVEIEIVNEYVHGNIRLTKVDAEYPDNKLTGATFEVYKDINENGKIDDGDELIGNLEETETGIYEMKELLYGKYIVRETKAPEGFLLDKGEYSVFIEKDETTYSVENKAGVGFINEAMRGTLKIVKTSSDGKVKGFAFRVTGANGYDMTFETDKNGEIVIEGLRIGEYTVSEVANNASAAYITPADQNVTIKLDETAVVKMHNELRDTPKTGDDTNMKLWYVLAGLSAVGIAVTSVVAHKKKKKEGNE